METFNVLRRTVVLMLSLVFVLAVTACNTVEGAGEDIEESGEAIEDAAE